ncbi:MAG: helix-turn-helix transcriptional regulator [Victivallales bacterium]|nr:helix-turn-helix transcriptional regulator [Victivallales bacterium]
MSPAVLSAHVYPLFHGQAGNFIHHSEWALEYHSRAAGFIELRDEPNRWRPRRARSIHLYAPGCYYREDTRKADFPLEENWFIFAAGKTEIFRQLFDSDLRFAAILDPDEKIGGLMRKAGEACELEGVRAFWNVQALFMEIIQLLTAVYRVRRDEWIINAEAEKTGNDFARETERYLRKNVARNLKTADIARYMKVSESSLNHRFKAITGISPIARLIEIRMEFAKTLLLKGEKLMNIAEMTGFYDGYHLSKTFKKQTGLSPRKFKKQR